VDEERLLQMAVLQVRRGADRGAVVERLVSKGMDRAEAEAQVSGIRRVVREDLRAAGTRSLLVGGALLALGLTMAVGLVGLGARRVYFAGGALIAGLAGLVRGAELLRRSLRLRDDAS
jgi:hypothetical protein